MTTEEIDYLRSLINKLDSVNSEILEQLHDHDLEDSEKYEELYESAYNMETAVTETQERNGWI